MTRNIKAIPTPWINSSNALAPPGHTTDRTILVGAMVVTLLMIAGVVWMHFVWNAPTNPVTGAVVQHDVSPLKTPSARANLTSAQKLYLELVEAGAITAHTHEQWLTAQQQIMGHRAGAAVPVTRAAIAAMPITASAASEVTRMQAVPGFQIHIDGQSTDSLVNSINEITQALPDKDARAFQKAVRILMVNSLPIGEMIATHQPASQLSEASMLAGARATLSGMDALDVMKAAQALHEKLVYQSATNTGPFAPPTAAQPHQ